MLTEPATDPLVIIDGVEEIVRNHMLLRGVYITSRVIDVRLAAQGAICGDHQACLVGAMCLAAGVLPRLADVEGEDEVERVAWQYQAVLAMAPACLRGGRDTLRAQHPPLDAAWSALDLAAREWVDAYEMDGESVVILGENDVDPDTHGWAEALFEAFAPVLGPVELLEITSRARSLLQSQAVG